MASRNPTRAFGLAALLGAALSVLGAEALAQDARELHARGVALFNEERYEEAAAAFREAYRLRPSWKLFYNIGQCEASAKRYDLALEAFESYLLQGGDDVPDDRREYVAAEIRRLQPLIGALDVAAPDGADIIVDGQVRAVTPLKGPLRVSAGMHRVVLRREGRILLEKEVQVAGAMTTSIEAPAQTGESAAPPTPPVKPEEGGPEPEGPGLSTWGWVGIGVGGVMILAGATTGGLALARGSELEDSCDNGECPPDKHDDMDAMERLALSSDILLGVGAAVAVTGLVLLLVDGSKESPESEATVSASLGPGLSLTWRY